MHICLFIINNLLKAYNQNKKIVKKKILVLGSSGQIGLHFCNYLKNKKYFVEKFDICEGKKFDLRKYNNVLLEKFIKKCDYIFFFSL